MVVRLDENEPQFCWVKKFENQCRGKDYRVKLSEIELLPNQTNEEQSNDADEEFGDDELENENDEVDVKRKLKEKNL